MTLQDLQSLFPNTGRNGAVTGLIPRDFFLAHEAEISAICRQHKLRRIYRGPRHNRYNTLKAQATAVLLYA